MKTRWRVNAVTRQRFVRRLLRWYASNGRDLPWRHTRDPYRILVSEIMLQQTQVSRVLRRMFFGNRPVSDRALWELSAAVLPRRRAYDFNQALMDFGATVCTARSPACPRCPLRSSCRAYPLVSPA